MTSPPSKRTVTDKLVDQELRRLTRQLENEYDRSCPYRAAGTPWFEQMSRAELKLHDLLGKRPISKAEITSTCDRAFRSLRTSLRAEPKPRLRECTDIETGVVRLIPDYE